MLKCFARVMHKYKADTISLMALGYTLCFSNIQISHSSKKAQVQTSTAAWESSFLALAIPRWRDNGQREVSICYTGHTAFLQSELETFTVIREESPRLMVCFSLDCTILTISCTGEVAPMFLTHSQRQMCMLHLINKKYRFNS